MTTETTTNRPMTVPTTREIKAALASIPTGKGEPENNTAILDAAHGCKIASRAMWRIIGEVRGTDAEAPIKAALYAVDEARLAFEVSAMSLVALMEEETAQRIADGRGADYLDMREA